jgi:hypothetical protein
MKKTGLFLLTLLALGSLAEAANVAPVVSVLSDKVTTYTWSAPLGTDTPTSAQLRACHDMSVQVTGTFGTTVVAVTGSMDDSVFATLDDTAGTPAALSFTAAGFKRVQQRALFIKPTLSGGTGTSLKVVVLCFTNYP